MKNLTRLRRAAFTAQKGNCFYCGYRMWSEHPREVFGNGLVSRAMARYFQCTAEHLRPLSEGGKDISSNVVAACWFCNQTRHRAKKPGSYERFAKLVRTRVAKGRWHCAGIRRAIAASRVTGV
jgi:hypothetical protein